MTDDDSIRLRNGHPRFKGDLHDLAAFLSLRHTPTGPPRAAALSAWQVYRAQTLVLRRRAAGQPLRKGDVKTVDKPVDLRGADLSPCCIGRVNLRCARLDGADLAHSFFKRADFSNASLVGARLTGAQFPDADLRGANLSGADLRGARFEGARLDGVTMNARTLLQGASFHKAHLAGAHLAGADLRGVDLRLTSLVGTDLRGAQMEGAQVYGCAAWDLKLDASTRRVQRLQANLSIDPNGAPLPSADSLEMAQFISLLIDNPKLRTVLDTVTSRGVLILGRFTPERKAVLDAARLRLRALGFYPMLFDFAPPDNRDTREVVKTLAGLAAFVLADVSDASSVPLELETLVTDFSIPFLIVKQHRKGSFAMLDTLYSRAGDRLSAPQAYRDADHLTGHLAQLSQWAMARARQLNARKHSAPPEELLP